MLLSGCWLEMGIQKEELRVQAGIGEDLFLGERRGSGVVGGRRRGKEGKGEAKKENRRLEGGPYFWCLRSANFLRVLLACFVAVFTSI